MDALHLDAIVSDEGTLTLTDLPCEPGEVVEVIVRRRSLEGKVRPGSTARALLESDLVGLWNERTDIEDPVAYARRLRDEAQERSLDGAA